MERQRTDAAAGHPRSYSVEANNAMGQALTAVLGNFNGGDGHLTPTRAFDNALTRTGNKVKAQYYYFSQGENIGDQLGLNMRATIAAGKKNGS